MKSIDQGFRIEDSIFNRFRSFDEGRTWEKLNNDAQQFGDINSMDGDSREPYVFYIATGSFGVKYGKPKA